MDYLRNWEGLSKEEYRVKKEEVTEVLLERLDKQFPGIRDSIEYVELATPKTMQRYTLNPEGTPYGYTQSKEQAGLKRLRNNFLIPNLYFASAWAFPGGGFEGSMLTGFLAALQMNRDKIWSEVDAEKYTDERIVKLTERKVTGDETLELSFEKPRGFKYQKGQYTVLQLNDPKVTELDLPYRWLPVESAPEEPVLKFGIKLKDDSFSKSCELLEVGDEAILFGPK